jgi:hypothetical protein
MIEQVNIRLLLMPSVILIVIRQAEGRKSFLATVQIGVPKSEFNIDMIVKGSDTRDLYHTLHGCIIVRTMIDGSNILNSRMTRGLLIVNAFHFVKGEDSTDNWRTLIRRR